MKAKILLIFSLIFLSFNSYANWSYTQYASAKLITGEYKSNQVKLGLKFDLKPGWKIYNDQESEVGFPTTAKFNNNLNIANYKILYPEAEKFIESGGFVSYGYQNSVLLPIIITAEDHKKTISSKVEINFALCKDICIPVTKTVFLLVNPGHKDKQNLKLINKTEKRIKASSHSLWVIYLSAFIAGIILNFMPCVLPVLLLKIVHFLEKRKKQRKAIMMTSIATLSGIFFSFMMLASMVIMLKLAGKTVGWGMHFQEPIFIAILAIILTLFVSNIFGHFEINISGKFVSKLNKASSTNVNFLKHFLAGSMVTILATPCSAPFLGTAIAFALTGSNFDIFSIFTFLALGLGLPYIVLIVSPKLLYYIPKPGKWMEKLKNILGIFLFATIIWLLFILKSQINIFGFILFVMELIIIYQFLRLKTNLRSFIKKKTYIAAIIINILLSISIIFAFSKHNNSTNIESDLWQDYKQINLEEIISDNKIAFVNITADWCLTCKYNELFVLNKTKIVNLFNNRKIIAIKADYTNSDPEIQELLSSVDRYAIPTYIIYSNNYPKGLVLEELPKESKIIEILNNELRTIK